MILSEKELNLSDSQISYIKSGWGSKVVDDTIVKRIIYESDNTKVKGFIAYPKNLNQKFPLIIWNRGGSRREGRIDEFLARGIYGEIASWGYAVLATEYREDDEFGGKDINDVLNLIPLADEISFCDSNRIGMEGWSRGGMMAYKVLTRTSKIKCAVIISGLADLFRSEKSRSDLSKVYRKLFGCEDETEFTEKMKERSAVYFADRINKDTKMLLIHGTSDNEVSYQDSVDMYEKLKENNIECGLKLIEGGDHYLKKHRVEINKYRRDWFDKFLKN